jgi:Fission yeast centromere protein N-terminal domain
METSLTSQNDNTTAISDTPPKLRESYTEAERKALRTYHFKDNGGTTKAKDLQQWFSDRYARAIPQPVISRILSKKYEYLDDDSVPLKPERKRKRGSAWNEFEAELEAALQPSGSVEEDADAEGEPDFAGGEQEGEGSEVQEVTAGASRTGSAPVAGSTGDHLPNINGAVSNVAQASPATEARGGQPKRRKTNSKVSLTTHLLRMDQKVWRNATQHPFLKHAGEGTLPSTGMQAFIAQDR